MARRLHEELNGPELSPAAAAVRRNRKAPTFYTPQVCKIACPAVSSSYGECCFCICISNGRRSSDLKVESGHEARPAMNVRFRTIVRNVQRLMAAAIPCWNPEMSYADLEGEMQHQGLSRAHLHAHCRYLELQHSRQKQRLQAMLKSPRLQKLQLQNQQALSHPSKLRATSLKGLPALPARSRVAKQGCLSTTLLKTRPLQDPGAAPKPFLQSSKSFTHS